MFRDAPNVQSLWGALIVEELVRNGVTAFVVCPGSRSTPLVQAVARHPGATVVLWNDERGAAYHALGWGRATGQPAAVITTSGTAVANLLPAAIEADLAQVPLLLLTADRPPELREAGANQSIRQAGLFDGTVRWAFDLPVPNDATPARMVLTTVDHAVFRAGSETHPGPVHLNCPFREPLAPSPEPWDPDCLEGLDDWLEGERAHTTVHEPLSAWPLDEAWFGELAEALREVELGLVVVGDAPPGHGGEEVARLLGWPVWIDQRASRPEGAAVANHLPHVDRLLGRGFDPQVILQLGARIESKRIQSWIDAGHVPDVLVVHPAPERFDPGHRVTHRFVAPIAPWCDSLWEHLAPQHPDPESLPTLPADLVARHARLAQALDRAVEEGTAPSEPWVAREITRRLDAEHALFVSNSMPVRDLQRFGVKDRPELVVAANRGASGIDGILATAAGYAQGAGRPVTLLVGDLAFLHDVNALAHLADLEQPVTVVVLNNGGGSIFSFLPIAEHRDVLDPWVQTPHDLRFEGLATTFGLPYERVTTREDFSRAYAAAAASGRSALLEVASGLAENAAQHARIEAALDAALDPA
jgi:2-succinyl-5-enolpyruvyl-6-hydroxy-3-cyclohexene-1-carboxylate synthase